ncbi:hypothetical protein Ahy_A06g030413 [Arachis hypogaea]|uniref:Pectinesterase inhibitor domain-containing protein n=1 Tax=Arachis hypogaea TaxID=3818 RepID=A0A445CW66_ARAHY|nr:hypothetical protein Ahy_A06g030413 [Arachis hypogaea]
MACHFNGNNVRPYSLILTLVFAFLLFDATSNAQKIVKVEEICKQTKIFAYCSNLLNSIPGGAARADVDSLAHYTIEVIRSKLKNTVNLLNTLIAKTTDPKAKEVYNFCLKQFTGDDGALAEIDPMQRSLKAKDYNYTLDCSFFVWVDEIEGQWEGLRRGLSKRKMHKDVLEAEAEVKMLMNLGRIEAGVNRLRLWLVIMSMVVVCNLVCLVYLIFSRF